VTLLNKGWLGDRLITERDIRELDRRVSERIRKIEWMLTNSSKRKRSRWG
jgi:predicted DNA-binding transcriptional regulator